MCSQTILDQPGNTRRHGSLGKTRFYLVPVWNQICSCVDVLLFGVNMSASQRLSGPGSEPALAQFSVGLSMLKVENAPIDSNKLNTAYVNAPLPVSVNLQLLIVYLNSDLKNESCVIMTCNFENLTLVSGSFLLQCCFGRHSDMQLFGQEREYIYNLIEYNYSILASFKKSPCLPVLTYSRYKRGTFSVLGTNDLLCHPNQC